MVTIEEARKIQKQREKKAIYSFIVSLILIGVGSFALFNFTDVLAISSIFYLIPIGLIALAVKKTNIYKFLQPKEFTGKIVRMDVYPVKLGKVRGDKLYEQSWGETLEVSLYVDNGKKTKNVAVLAGRETWDLAEEKKVAILRFIYYPIIVD